MPSRPVRIAAVGDVHAAPFDRAAAGAAVAAAADADCLLIAGDLTATGEPEEAAVLAEILAESAVPVLYVLGNHDWHANRVPELREVLDGAGARMLERDHAELQVDGRMVGIVGLKGFVGGFAGSSLPDFGEPLLRQVHAAATTDVVALDSGLDAVAHCDVRVVLLHYAPTDATLAGEPVASDRGRSRSAHARQHCLRSAPIRHGLSGRRRDVGQRQEDGEPATGDA